MFLKASFGSYCTLTSQHGMSFSSRARAIYSDVSTATPHCGSVGDAQVAILEVLVPNIITTSQTAA